MTPVRIIDLFIFEMPTPHFTDDNLIKMVDQLTLDWLEQSQWGQWASVLFPLPILVPFPRNANHSRPPHTIPPTQGFGDLILSDCLWDHGCSLCKLLVSPPEKAANGGGTWKWWDKGNSGNLVYRDTPRNANSHKKNITRVYCWECVMREQMREREMGKKEGRSENP